MQILHFGYALGAFVAPLIAKQFISEERPEDLANMTEFMSNATSASSSRFYLAYWISSATLVPTLLAFTYYAYRYDILGFVHRRGWGVALSPTKYSKITQSEDETSNDDDDKVSEETKDMREEAGKKVEPKSKAYSPFFQHGIVLLLCLFIFVYVGLECAYGSWIFTAAVIGPLGFTKDRATVIQSLYWGTLAFSRLLSVLLAFCNVRSSVMLAGNLFGSILAGVIMATFPNNEIAIWIASGLLGVCFASIFPTVLVWMSETVRPTGIGTSIIITGGNLGNISIPTAMGALISEVSPNSIFYITFVGVIVCTIVYALAFIIDFFYKRHLVAASAAADNLSDVTTTRKNGVHRMEKIQREKEITE